MTPEVRGIVDDDGGMEVPELAQGSGLAEIGRHDGDAVLGIARACRIDIDAVDGCMRKIFFPEMRAGTAEDAELDEAEFLLAKRAEEEFVFFEKIIRERAFVSMAGDAELVELAPTLEKAAFFRFAGRDAAARRVIVERGLRFF